MAGATPVRWLETGIFVNRRADREGMMARVFVSYRHVEPDESIARSLEHALCTAGHAVFLDTKIEIGSAWGAATEALIRSAQFFIVLLSAESIRSEMVRCEVKLAP